MGRLAGAYTIGEFSRRTQLTARALRHYAELGLLVPATIDKATGYRYYTSDQEATARRIARLRGVGLTLVQIAELLTASDEALRAALERRRDELEAQISSDRRTLDEVNNWIQGGEAMTFDIGTVTLEPEAIATFRWRGEARDPLMVDSRPWVELATAVAGAGGVFVATIGLANVFDVDGLADLELGYVTDDLLPPGEGYQSRVIDGGLFARVAFDTWSEKGAAYEALELWLKDSGAKRRGPSRERGPLIGAVEPRLPDAEMILDPSPSGWRTEVLLPIV